MPNPHLENDGDQKPKKEMSPSRLRLIGAALASTAVFGGLAAKSVMHDSNPKKADAHPVTTTVPRTETTTTLSEGAVGAPTEVHVAIAEERVESPEVAERLREKLTAIASKAFELEQKGVGETHRTVDEKIDHEEVALTSRDESGNLVTLSMALPHSANSDPTQVSSIQFAVSSISEAGEAQDLTNFSASQGFDGSILFAGDATTEFAMEEFGEAHKSINYTAAALRVLESLDANNIGQ